MAGPLARGAQGVVLGGGEPAEVGGDGVGVGLNRHSGSFVSPRPVAGRARSRAARPIRARRARPARPGAAAGPWPAGTASLPAGSSVRARRGGPGTGVRCPGTPGGSRTRRGWPGRVGWAYSLTGSRCPILHRPGCKPRARAGRGARRCRPASRQTVRHPVAAAPPTRAARSASGPTPPRRRSRPARRRGGRPARLTACRSPAGGRGERATARRRPARPPPRRAGPWECPKEARAAPAGRQLSAAGGGARERPGRWRGRRLPE